MRPQSERGHRGEAPGPRGEGGVYRRTEVLPPLVSGRSADVAAHADASRVTLFCTVIRLFSIPQRFL